MFEEYDRDRRLDFIYANYDEFYNWLLCSDTDVLDLLMMKGVDGVLDDKSGKVKDALDKFFIFFDIEEYFNT